MQIEKTGKNELAYEQHLSDLADIPIMEQDLAKIKDDCINTLNKLIGNGGKETERKRMRLNK